MRYDGHIGHICVMCQLLPGQPVAEASIAILRISFLSLAFLSSPFALPFPFPLDYP